MLHICRLCGHTFEGAPGSVTCPDCVAAQRRTTLRPRICRACGVTFSGGPRAWYCPKCRADRKRQHKREYEQRRHNGQTRPIGSTAFCTACGQPYTVTGGLQRYCPDCAQREFRANDAKQAREWYAANVSPETRRKARRAASAQIPCVICGKLFTPTSPAKTCSPACSRELRRRSCKAWYERQKEDTP